MLNVVVLMGRLTADPELRHTQSGVPSCSVSLAVERDYVDKGGNRQADFINCQTWRGTAEFIARHFTKGSMVAVTGRLRRENSRTSKATPARPMR